MTPLLRVWVLLDSKILSKLFIYIFKLFINAYISVKYHELWDTLIVYHDDKICWEKSLTNQM